MSLYFSSSLISTGCLLVSCVFEWGDEVDSLYSRLSGGTLSIPSLIGGERGEDGDSVVGEDVCF